MCAGGEESSSLFRDEEKPLASMRRRQVPRTQMGPPHLRKREERRRPLLEWAKAIAICLAVASGFLSFVWLRRSRHLRRRSANFAKLDKCDLKTYPLWQIEVLEELNLSNCNHISLPADSELWSRFTSLKKLDLNNNSLTELPDEMGVLSSLDVLFLSENKFQSIPKVIGKMGGLRVLSLRGNLLRDVSASNLPHSTLVWLILTNNKIESIDANVGDLKLLRKLMLSHNLLESVPVELGECKDLELVRLANNKLSSVPKEVMTLPKLAWISLSGNPMSKPPDNIKKIIKESEIQMQGKVLGRGASGTVYRGRYNGKDVAVKMFKEQSKGSDGNSADEAAINGLIDHPLAISAIGVIPLEGEEGVFKGMVMDLLGGTYPLGRVPSFDTVTRNAGPAPHSENLSEDQVRGVVWNMASVLNYVHSSRGLSHGDVYLHNVLRDGEFVARLSDWGASFVHGEGYAAHAEAIEVLAFGRLVQNLYAWHLDVAVPDLTEPAGSPGRLGSRGMDEGPLRELVGSILQPDQSRRPSFAEIEEGLRMMPAFEKFRK